MSSEIEFLQVCRLVLKGERHDSDLEEAIRTARANLRQVKEEFLAHVSPPGDSIQVKQAGDTVLAAIQSYSSGIDIIESYLQTKDKTVLAKGMEQVRQAIERMEAGFHRYQAALLALRGPTDMPGYNLIANTLEEFKQKKISRNDFEGLVRAAHDSVQKSLQSIATHLHLKEVKKLKEAYEAHQAALALLIERLAEEKPSSEALSQFQKSCELIRDSRIPAQIKIFTEKPTPSNAANFMINLTGEIISGNIHPSYFHEALKHLKMEYELFNRQLKEIEDKRNAEQIAEGREALALYGRALDGYKKFQETMESKHLPQASLQLENAISQLYRVLKS